MTKMQKINITSNLEPPSLNESPGILAKRKFVKRDIWSPKQNLDFDPFCDPDNPKTITYKQVIKAREKTEGFILDTPLTKSKSTKYFPMDVYYKWEIFHRTGSFKERGAFYSLSMLNPDQQQRGVITASLGNWAMALAYYGQQLNVPVTVVLPVSTSTRTCAVCEDFGAAVVLHGDSLSEAEKKAFTIRTDQNLTYINGSDHPDVIAASGCIGIEILNQLPQIEAIMVPVGGGSLIAGIAVAVKHIKPDVLIYGVQSQDSCCFLKALENGRPCETTLKRNLATSLEIPSAGYNTFHTAKSLIDGMVLVDNDWLSKAILHMMEVEKLVVEGAGAITVASVMALPQVIKVLKGKTVVCVISGGNLKPILYKCLERAKALEGRLVNLQAIVPEQRTDKFREIFEAIANLGSNVLHQEVDRHWSLKNDYYNITMSMTCETRDHEHARIFKKVIEKYFTNICQVKENNLCFSEFCNCYSCR